MKAIGVDLGGTKIHAALVDDRGSILREFKHETMGHTNRKTVVNRIYQAIDNVMEEDVIGIGISSPGFIDSKKGVVRFAGNIKGWSGMNIRKVFGAHYPEKIITVENDANVAGLCEQWIGSATKFSSFIMVTLGTGLGGVIFSQEGGLWRGSHYQGAELGHVILHPNGRKCTCGQLGCVERYCAGTALSYNYLQRTGRHRKGADIIDRLETEKAARDALDEWIEDFSTFLVTIKNAWDPDGLVIGGGFIHAKEYWWDEVLTRYQKKCNNSQGMTVIPAMYLNSAGVIGAAKTVFDNKKRRH